MRTISIDALGRALFWGVVAIGALATGQHLIVIALLGS